MDSKIIGLSVRKESTKEDISRIYSRLFANATDRSQLQFEELSGGYVNQIVKVAPINEQHKPLIFRSFDLKLDFNELFARTDDDEASLDASLLLNRSSEFEVMELLSKHGLCGQVRAKYVNGIVYDYFDGQPVNAYLMLSDEFLSEMSAKLAKLHSLSLPELQTPNLETHFHKMTSPDQMNEMQRQLDEQIEQIDEEPYRSFPKISDLFGEEQKILQKLEQLGLGEPVPLCHNDCNQKNIIYNAKAEPGHRLSLIDFELAMPNYPAMELGYLFTSFVGHFLDSFNKKFFPTEEYRMRFLAAYLRERKRLAGSDDPKCCDQKAQQGDQFKDELNLLHIRTNLFILYYLVFLVKGLPLYDIREELKTEELMKLSKGNRYYYGQIAYSAWEIFEELKDDFMRLADDRLAKKTDL